MKKPLRDFHVRFWFAVALVLPLVFFLVLSMKQTPEGLEEPAFLEAPR